MNCWIILAATGPATVVGMYALGVMAQDLKRKKRELDDRWRLLHSEMRRFEAQKRGER